MAGKNCVCVWLTNAFRHNATAVGWVNHPVIVLDGVQGLNDGADTTNVTVDLSIVDKLIWQIHVQPTLHLSQCNEWQTALTPPIIYNEIRSTLHIKVFLKDKTSSQKKRIGLKYTHISILKLDRIDSSMQQLFTESNSDITFAATWTHCVSGILNCIYFKNYWKVLVSF